MNPLSASLTSKDREPEESLARLPDESLRQVLDLNRRVARAEARMARWLLVETGTTRKLVMSGIEVRAGHWLALPCDVALVVELRSHILARGGEPGPAKVRIRLSGTECQFRQPGTEYPSQAIRPVELPSTAVPTVPDPEEDALDVCGLLRTIRHMGGLAWESMPQIAVVTVRLPFSTSQLLMVP